MRCIIAWGTVTARRGAQFGAGLMVLALVLAPVLFVEAAAQNRAPVPVILDTDMESDVDDVGALAMLHALADRGEAQILGVMVSAKNPYAMLTADRINTYFGRPDLPLGQIKSEGVDRESRYARHIAEEFPGQLASAEDAPDAVVLYREILAAQPDNSVVLVTIGYKTNVRDLLASGPCEHSEFDGRELAAQKFRIWICMGGHFPGGREANIRWDARASVEAIENWPTDIIFNGWEIGRYIYTGGGLAELPEDSPVRRSYQLFNNLQPHRSWDQAALLYAVRGLDDGPAADYWDLSPPGRIVIDPEDGSNTWEDDPEGTHRHHIARRDPELIAEEIDVLMMHQPAAAHTGDSGRIRPYVENPFYWQYKGEPILLLGGSWQDNLFNHPRRLEEHLDLLVSVGGNYARNTMSHRNRDNVFAFAQNDEGLYDLDQFNEEYWERFENFLRLTHERNIIVQIEIWDPHDHYRDREPRGGWSKHPFNPLNNINYTAEESGLPTEVTYGVTPWPSEHAFFRTVPALHNNERVLAYQVAFVDRMLEYSLKYPHVIYTMNNEIGELNEWGDFWAGHVQQRAAEAGVTIYTSDMRRDHNIRTDDHRHIYDRPELYTFLDISQVTGSRGQSHFDDIMYVREYISGRPQPINNVKNYGAAKHGEHESMARFFRFIFAGGASTRFHRPHPIEDPDEHERATNWGLGLSPRAQTVIRVMREVDGVFDVFRSEPRNDLLSNREPNEAYVLATPGEQYAVYFPEGGSVTLDLSDVPGEMAMRRIDIDMVEWRDEGTVAGGGAITLSAPAPSHVNEANAQPENLVVNGSFEADPLPEAPGYTASISGWLLCNNHGHLLNCADGPFYTPVLGPIPEGERIYGKQGPGRLMQRLRFQDGQPFSLSFRVNCREGNDGMDLTVRIGQQVLWNETVTPNHGEFHRVEVENVYDAAWGDTLAFEFSNPQGDATLLLDDVRLWSVPGFGKHCIVVIAKE